MNYKWHLPNRTIKQRTERKKQHDLLTGKQNSRHQTRPKTGKRKKIARTSKVRGEESKTRATRPRWVRDDIFGRYNTFLTDGGNGNRIKKLQNYEYITQTRQLARNWNKVIMLTTLKQNRAERYPDPRASTYKHQHRVNYLGNKYANVEIKVSQSIILRHADKVFRAVVVCGAGCPLKRPILTHQMIAGNIRILMRNALVRTTLTYALHTEDRRKNIKQTPSQFANKCHIEIHDSRRVETHTEILQSERYRRANKITNRKARIQSMGGTRP